jgi:hypothetical protein
LNEFDLIKDTAPNAAAILFRTILMMVIYKRAESKGLEVNYRTFNLGPMIDRARNDGIFERSDQRYLEHFLTSGKAVFDNVAHSPNANGLAEKDHLATMIAPLNKLLRGGLRIIGCPITQTCQRRPE